MKYFYLLLFVVVLSSCASDKSVLVKTNSTEQSIENSKVLYLIGKKEITKDQLAEISPENIAQIEVIKDPKKIKKYSSERYDGVIIITLKKD